MNRKILLITKPGVAKPEDFVEYTANKFNKIVQNYFGYQHTVLVNLAGVDRENMSEFIATKTSEQRRSYGSEEWNHKISVWYVFVNCGEDPQEFCANHNMKKTVMENIFEVTADNIYRVAGRLNVGGLGHA